MTGMSLWSGTPFSEVKMSFLTIGAYNLEFSSARRLERNLCPNPVQYRRREHLSSLGSLSDSDRVI